MTPLTRWVLRHKLIVSVCWLPAAVAGAASATSATHRMVNSFSLPGASIATNDKIAAIYRIGGGIDPLIPVITVPAGQNVASPAAAARVAMVLGAARVSPAVQLVDYRTTADRVFMDIRARRIRRAQQCVAPTGGHQGPAG
jgi:putative drug exporter of the RND superfamily